MEAARGQKSSWGLRMESPIQLGWNQGRGLRGGRSSGMSKIRSSEPSRAELGRVFRAEGTAWIKAQHVCNYCFSDEQPQGVPGQDLHFMCIIIYAFSVHMAFLSGVMTVITLLPKCMGTDRSSVSAGKYGFHL